MAYFTVTGCVLAAESETVNVIGVVVTFPPVAVTVGNWNWTALSGSALAVFTVFQSLARIPPVSPEFGFHDQYVQLTPCWPAARSTVPLPSRSPLR